MGMEAGILGSCVLDDASPAQKNTTGTVVVCMIPPEHTAVSCDDSCIFTLRQRSAHNLGPLAWSACREKKNTPRKKKKKKRRAVHFLDGLKSPLVRKVHQTFSRKNRLDS